MRRRLGLVIVGVLLFPASAAAVNLEPVGTFTNPTFVTSYPDDPDRLLMVERGGRVQLVDGGTTSVLLDATSLVGMIDGERGMWSIALAPDFTSTGKLYAFYAGSATGGDLQLDEFTAVGDSVDPATRRPVLTIEHSDSPNHNGGQLQFGSDGYLYISTGDGDRRAINAQDLTVLLGKILRIDPRQAGGAPYSVPADNPFVGIAGEDEIWSYGLRNPYRFSFDRESGAIAIGDVGRQTREEIDYDQIADVGRDSNYGWPCYEGTFDRNVTHALCADPVNLVFPIFEYGHVDGNCSITGGYVARDQSLGDLYGRYLYADFCVGQIRSLIPDVPLGSGDRSDGLTVDRPVSFGEDACGRLYVVSLLGAVSRLVGDQPADCTAGYARVIGGVLTVNAGAGVANRIQVTSSDSNTHWVVRDGAASIVAGPGCTLPAERIRCPKAGVTSLRMESADLRDRITTPNGLDTTVEAGTGNDEVRTGDGTDVLRGGSGTDKLDGGADPDTIDGGADRDLARYDRRGAAQSVEVSLDGVADDGGTLDDGSDNVLANVESVLGGGGADTLIGSAVRNTLTGGLGADILRGLAGDDTIHARGDGTSDTITCGAGSKDHVFADAIDSFQAAGPEACERVN